jgi:hypothetical protein
MNNYPECTNVAARLDEIIRRKEAPLLSERLSSRMVKLAVHLPENEFIGWQMEIPTDGLIQFDLFGTAAVRASDLEWIAEEAAHTFITENVCVADGGFEMSTDSELYEIHLPTDKGHASRSIGFGATSSSSNMKEMEKDPLNTVWPMYFTQQFGEFIRVLRVEGGMFRYTAGSASTEEQKACRNIVTNTWIGGPISVFEYVGSPVRIKVMLLIPSSPSARLRTVLNEVAPGAVLHKIGNIKDEGIRRIWENPMIEAHILPDFAARILAIEPTIGDKPVLGVESCQEEAKPIPAGHKNSTDKKALKIGIAMGTSGHSRDITISDIDLRRHWQIIGQTGTGKSTLLGAALREAIVQGRGVTFFDPHGTTIDSLLKSIPRKYVDRVRVVRIGDPDNTVPISMWESDNPDDCEKTISDLNLLLADIFDPRHEGIIGPRWERWFSIIASATIALLGKKASFDSILAVSQTRDSLEKLAIATRNTCSKASRAIMAEFVNNESRDFVDVISWCVSKLQRLTSIPQLRNTLGAGVNALDFRNVIDTDAVTLIDLASPAIGTQAARIVGTLILQQLWSAITARECRGKTHIVAIDEAHLFQTNPLPQMLAEGRKFGAAMILAHQHCGQLSPEVREALDANSANFTAFRLSVRDSFDAALKFDSDTFGKDLCRLNAFNALTTLSVEGKQTPTFTLQINKPKIEASGLAIAKSIEMNSLIRLVYPNRENRALTQDEVWKILCERAKDPISESDTIGQLAPAPMSRPAVPAYISKMKDMAQEQNQKTKKEVAV